MLRRYWAALTFGLLIATQSFAQEIRVQLDRPYVSLFEPSGVPSSSHELKSLRSSIESERDQKTEACRDEKKRLKTRLDSARDGLKRMNQSAPRDSAAMATGRGNLHAEIAALEKGLRDKKGECEHVIPAAFEIQLAKMRLLERWPLRQARTIQKIEDGLARERTHGDVEDIGYRKIASDPEKDIAVGEQAYRQMATSKAMPREVEDAGIREYIQELAGKIARNSDLKVPLHVTVLESPEINSVALPGGYLFVTSGLVQAAETESQLAGVLSQQIAHIAARHATRASKRSVLAKVFVPAAQIATGLFTGGVSSASALYGMNYGFQGLGMLVDRALVDSSEKGQKEADQLGIQYAWKAGFDPKGFVAFLDSVATEREYSKTDSFFLTKPALGERLVDAFTEIQYLQPRANYTIDSAEFRQAREHLRRSPGS